MAHSFPTRRSSDLFVTHLSGETGTAVIETISVTNGSATGGNGVTAPTGPSEMERDFLRYASRYGLQAGDLGRKIKLGKSGRKRYTLVGAKPRNYKMPILVRGPRGGIYKISVERAKNGLV